MPGYWQTKPAQRCHSFKKLEDVTSYFESTYKTLSVICFHFFSFNDTCPWKWRVLLCYNRILNLQVSRWIYISNVNRLDSTLFMEICFSTLNFGIALLSGKGTSVWPLPLAVPEPALTATRGAAAGGCEIQVLVLGMYFYSCAIWVFGHFLLLYLGYLHFWLFWAVEQPMGDLLGQTVYDSPLSSLMPFALNHSYVRAI